MRRHLSLLCIPVGVVVHGWELIEECFSFSQVDVTFCTSNRRLDGFHFGGCCSRIKSLESIMATIGAVTFVPLVAIL